MTSEQPEKYAYCENENNQTVFGDNLSCTVTKTGITDLFWKDWIELYVAQNLNLVRTSKRRVIILFTPYNFSCQ